MRRLPQPPTQTLSGRSDRPEPLVVEAPGATVVTPETDAVLVPAVTVIAPKAAVVDLADPAAVARGLQLWRRSEVTSQTKGVLST